VKVANVSEDPPSPADAYGPPASVAAPGVVPPPPVAPQYTAAPQYPPYAYGAAAPRTNVLAIISLVASCVGLVFPLGYIAGVVMGHIALSQIKRTGEGGRGLALAGVIVGYSLLALWILIAVAYIIFIVVIIGTASSTGDFNESSFG
jgi:hypothetical protein